MPLIYTNVFHDKQRSGDEKIMAFIFDNYLEIETQHQSQSTEAAARTDLLCVHRLLWIHRPQLFHFLKLK